MVKYIYDAWGNHDVIDYTSWGLGELNPIRYRSYYFDIETGLYYLQSRYYDPSVCRFINSDEIICLNMNYTITSSNLYCYCTNDCINTTDESGFASNVVQSVVGGIVDGFADIFQTFLYLTPTAQQRIRNNI